MNLVRDKPIFGAEPPFMRKIILFEYVITDSQGAYSLNIIGWYLG